MRTEFTIPHGDELIVHDPATEDELGRVRPADSQSIDAAVAAARLASRPWAATPVLERARVVARACTLLEAHREELAQLVARENGKALRDGRAEVRRGIEVAEFATGMPTHMQGVTATDVGRQVDAETRLYPVGVVAAITPFNFPAMIPLWSVPIALAAGNSVVLKPSEQTPLTAVRIAELFAEAELPENLLQVVHGAKDAVDALLGHPGIDAVSFVGSAAVARHVYTTAAANGKRVQALAGAKNFLIALDDAPLEASANAIFESAFGNAGQRCLAGSVLLVTRGIAERLVDALVDRARDARVGPGTDPESSITPLINDAACERVLSAVRNACAEGAEIAYGGEREDRAGYFVQPTLLRSPHPDLEIFSEEVFGPVLAILEVDDLESAIEIANRSEYGNSSSLFTSSGGAAREYRERIEAGMLGINIGVPAPVGFLPFSGWKGSFYGDLHANGLDAVRFYTKPKAITTRWPA